MTDRDQAFAATEMSPAAADRTATLGTLTEGVAAKLTGPRMLGRYRLERELGVGGMGIVHAAFDPELERRVAIKLILRATSDEARSRLLREARAMARLTHPNIITIYEIGSEAGRDFVTMELIDGGSLSDWLRAERRPTREILDAFIAAGRGLAAAHEAGIIHRDFKPHNVLRSLSGRIVVGDFGLATGLDTQVEIADIALENHTELTATGSWVGTPAYMAPEQWHGGTILPATDQFAFCVALWEALAGQRPYRGETLEELRKAVTAGPGKLSTANIPMRLRGVLKRGLDPEPAQRWPSMTALLAALRPDRKKLYLGAAAAAGLALSASVVALAVTRGSATEPMRGRDQPALLVPEIKTQLAAEAKRHAAVASRLVNREIANAFRVRPAQVVLRPISRMTNGHVEVPEDAIEPLVDELTAGKAVRLVPMNDRGKAIGLKAYAMTPGSLVDAIGLSNGDVIAAIDGHPTTSEKELREAADRIDADARTVKLDVLRGEDRMIIIIQSREPSEPPEPPETPEPPEPPEPDVRLE